MKTRVPITIWQARECIACGARIISRDYDVGVGLYTTHLLYEGSQLTCYSMTPLWGKIV